MSIAIALAKSNPFSGFNSPFVENLLTTLFKFKLEMFSFDFEINSVGSVLLNKEDHLLSVLSIAIDDSFTLKSIPPDSLS